MPVVAEAVGFEARLLLIASSCQVDEADLSTDFRLPLVGCTPQDAAGCFSSRKISGLMLLPFICFCCVHQVMHVRRLLIASQVIQVESIYVCMPSGRTQADAIHMLQAPKGEGTDFAADVSFQLANGPLSSFLLLLVSLCCLNYMLKIQRQVCACACICTKTGVCACMCANYQTEYPLVVQCDESAYSEVFRAQEVSFGGSDYPPKKIWSEYSEANEIVLPH